MSQSASHKYITSQQKSAQSTGAGYISFSCEMCHLYLIFWILSPAYGSRSALSNAHIKLGAEEWPPFLVIEKDENGTAIYSGIHMDIIESVQKATNCTFTLVRPPDGLWGNCHEENNCTGMIGLVQRKEVDFAMGIIFMFCI